MLGITENRAIFLLHVTLTLIQYTDKLVYQKMRSAMEKNNIRRLGSV